MVPACFSSLPAALCVEILSKLDQGERWAAAAATASCWQRRGVDSGSAAACRWCHGPSHPAQPDPLLLLLPACRCRTAALVCKRWKRLVRSPALVRATGISLACSSNAGWKRLRRLLAWLRRHRAMRSLRRLQLKLALSPAPETSPEQESAHLARLLGRLGSARKLSELRLSLAQLPLAAGTWLGDLQHLQRLRIDSHLLLTIAAPLHGLTALRDLQLTASQLSLGPCATLPVALTSLHLEVGELLAGGLPPQVGAVLCRSCRCHWRRLLMPGASSAAGQSDCPPSSCRPFCRRNSAPAHHPWPVSAFANPPCCSWSH